MRIYVVRHGESEGNVEKSYHGSSDYALSEKGREQVQRLRESIMKAEVLHRREKKIFSSNTKRTRETAEGLNLGEITIDHRIRERDFGIFEGLKYSEIKERYPEECAHWEEDWTNYRPRGGESHMDVCKRVFDFMDEIEEGDEDVILITHGGIIRAIYCYVMDKRPELFWKFACGNCHMGVIKFEYGNFFLEKMIEI